MAFDWEPEPDPESNKITVKFAPSVSLLADETGAYAVLAPFWAGLVATFGVTLSSICDSDQGRADLDQLELLAQERDPDYAPEGLSRVFVLTCGIDVRDEVLGLLKAQSDVVEHAYVTPRAVPAGVNTGPGANPWSPQQGYLLPAPIGIDAVFAWTQPGGDGLGQLVADVEYDWMFDHEDIPSSKVFRDYGFMPASGGVAADVLSQDHGTATVGVICATDNLLGVVGIAPGVSRVSCMSPFDAKGVYAYERLYKAIRAAIDRFDDPKGGKNSWGRVILLEIALTTPIPKQPGVFTQLPFETDPAVFKLIRLASGLGIIVVEPAGNGGTDLDLSASSLIRDSKSGDSGAIVVGAADVFSDPTRPRTPQCNFGARVDVFAWGGHITAPSSYDPKDAAPTKYTNSFRFTSGASAIVAGAVLSLQGFIEDRTSERIGPRLMRTILSDPRYNTASSSPSDRIGVMPDLKRLMTAITQSSVILRDKTITFTPWAGATLTFQAVTFDVNSLTSPVQITMTTPPLPPFSLVSTTQTIPVAPGLGQTAEFWFAYASGLVELVPGAFPSAVVSFVAEHDGTSETFDVAFATSEQWTPYATTVLVLDQSGSMNEVVGSTGLVKQAALAAAADVFLAITGVDNMVGAVSFADASTEILPLTMVTDVTVDPSYQQAVDTVHAALVAKPAGKTALGQGVQAGLAILAQQTSAKYADAKSLLVVTDGQENVLPFVANVLAHAPTPVPHVYAIGIGDAKQLGAKALAELTASTGAYALFTGEAGAGTEPYFRLSKYVLEVLTDATGKDVVLDPSGTLNRGDTVRVPFPVCEADHGVEVVVMSDVEEGMRLALLAPDGRLFSAPCPGLEMVHWRQTTAIRLSLPLVSGDVASHGGSWLALISYGGRKRPSLRGARGRDRDVARYAATVQSTSSLHLRAAANQIQTDGRLVVEVDAWLESTSELTEVIVQVDLADDFGAIGTRTADSPDGRRYRIQLRPRSEGVLRLLVRATGLAGDDEFARDKNLSLVVGLTE